MSTREILRMLGDARRLNFVAYLAWGGEPLLRPDIGEILRYAHNLGLYTSIITNGTYLSQKAEEIVDCVDLTWVSLDYSSEYHDQMRGSPGAFGKAIRGIVALRRMGGRIAINCVLSKLNMDCVGKMAALADRLGARVAFDPMKQFGEVNEEYALSAVELDRLSSQIFECKRAGYPILNSYDYLSHLRRPANYSCAQPRVFITVTESGEIVPFWCEKEKHTLGDLRNQSLGEVLSSRRYSEFVKATAGCSLCTNSTTVEVSMFYSTRNFLIGCARIPNPILSFILNYGF
jgi:MoaA/NifB/PqqE/SkfB family radical SAM enzyme